MSKWLKCKINKGMFSDELNVTVNTSSGDVFAVFVPKLEADDRKNLVKVHVYEREGKTIAVLPDELQSVIAVNESDLQAA